MVLVQLVPDLGKTHPQLCSQPPVHFSATLYQRRLPRVASNGFWVDLVLCAYVSQNLLPPCERRDARSTQQQMRFRELSCHDWRQRCGFWLDMYHFWYGFWLWRRWLLNFDFYDVALRCSTQSQAHLFIVRVPINAGHCRCPSTIYARPNTIIEKRVMASKFMSSRTTLGSGSVMFPCLRVSQPIADLLTLYD